MKMISLPEDESSLPAGEIVGKPKTEHKLGDGAFTPQIVESCSALCLSSLTPNRGDAPPP
jgi:hypothetical protein